MSFPESANSRTEGDQVPGSRALQTWRPRTPWLLTLEASHGPPVHVLVTDADE